MYLTEASLHINVYHHVYFLYVYFTGFKTDYTNKRAQNNRHINGSVFYYFINVSQTQCW
jgi:hypothetical protein